MVSCIESEMMLESHCTGWLTQVKIVVVGITEEHKSSNDVSNG